MSLLKTKSFYNVKDKDGKTKFVEKYYLEDFPFKNYILI
jgi:hypothetical protein